MAIKRDFIGQRKDGVKLYRHYSDRGVYLHKLGTDEIYAEAVDVETAPYIYEETEEIIEKAEV